MLEWKEIKEEVRKQSKEIMLRIGEAKEKIEELEGEEERTAITATCVTILLLGASGRQKRSILNLAKFLSGLTESGELDLPLKGKSRSEDNSR